MNGVIVFREDKELVKKVIAEKRRLFNEVPTFRIEPRTIRRVKL